MSRLNEAIDYNSKGLITIPVKEKKPLIDSWKKYQQVKPTSQELQNWFSNGSNIAIVTGKISNLIVLDIDTKDALDYVAKKGLPETWINKTNKGYHYYFKFNDSITGTTTMTQLGQVPGLDVRGEGGYVVVYTWLPGHSPNDLPLAELPTWLKDLLNSEKRGKEVKTQEYIKWVTELLQGVSEGRRHEALTRLAGYYYSHLPYDIARQHLIDWNKKNSPPLDDNELSYQLDDFETKFKTGEYSSLTLFGINQEFRAPMDIHSFLGSEPPEIKWISEGVIPKQGVVIIGGREKLGKSWLIHDLAIEISRGGGRWLGSIPTKGGRVLYIDEESTEGLLKLRFTKLLKAKGLVGHPLDLHLMVGNHLNFSNFESVDNLRKTLEQLRPDVIFIDSLIRVSDAEENSATEMKKIFRVVKKLKQDFDCTFVFTDHERKAFGDETGQNRLRGTTEKAAFVDSLVSLFMKDTSLLLEHTFSRFAPSLGTFVLNIEDPKIDQTIVKIVRG